MTCSAALDNRSVDGDDLRECLLCGFCVALALAEVRSLWVVYTSSGGVLFSPFGRACAKKNPIHISTVHSSSSSSSPFPPSACTSYHQHYPWIHHLQTWNSVHHLTYPHLHQSGKRTRARCRLLGVLLPGSLQHFRLDWPYVLDVFLSYPFSADIGIMHATAASPLPRGCQFTPNVQLNPSRFQPYFKSCDTNSSGSSLSSAQRNCKPTSRY